ncbi:hypothetical protein PHYPSEUDO_001326 [Phytophthora pseudosyringae]|uniref:RxLR effector protein n=1 Tax=Phytophthora pseudosyringae TaxID=221518 RepID=A0A8T1W064_9STRA|nr:hypothetical protein PHYPSEUDO_001326 [Phytophthora pseudosyringae]
MCVYLAPRWRRRSSPLQVATLVLALALLLLTAVDGRTLRLEETGNSGYGSTAVGKQEVGVVTTDTQQSTTTVTTRAWNSGSYRDASQLSDEKSVSFDSLVKTTTAPTAERDRKQSKGAASSASGSASNDVQTPETVTASSDSSSNGATKDRSRKNAGGPKQDNADDGSDGSFDDGEKDESADRSADSKTGKDTTSSQTGTTNKAPTPAPTPARTPGPTPTPTSAKPPPHPGSFDAGSKGWTSSSGSSEQSVKGQSYELGSTNSAKALENKTKSSASTTSTSSLDQTLVVVIVGVVGAIGALLMFVSRKVLKETGDDNDLEDSSIF